MQDENFHCDPDTKRRYFDDILGPQEYIPEMWTVKKDLVYKLIPCLQAGLENTQSAFAEHDSSLGRTTTKNRMWAETLEQEIRDMKDCIEQLKVIDIINTLPMNQLKTKNLDCDGRCGQYGTCQGEVKNVTVKSGDERRSWGTYNYCESAIREDEKNGYIVLPNE